jgi:DNA-binding CsgD family transcriptional regulator
MSRHMPPVRRLRGLLVTMRDWLSAAQPGKGSPVAVLRELADVIGVTALSYVEMDIKAQTEGPSIEIGQFEDPGQLALEASLAPVFWQHFARSHCNTPDRTGDYTLVLTDKDNSGRMRSPIFCEYQRPLGAFHTMTVSMPPGAGGVRPRFMLIRGRTDPSFSDADNLTMELLRPHLYQLMRGRQRSHPGLAKVTAREREVLRLAALGNHNTDIARGLHISRSTVCKHLENIYSKLGVTNRAQAAALLYPPDLL